MKSKVSRFREKHLYGHTYCPPDIKGYFGKWIPMVILDWPKIPVRERFFRDMPYYNRWSGLPKPWQKRRYADAE